MGKRDKLSVFISLVLRHNPGAAQITLDEHGWADVEELLAGMNSTGRSIDRKRWRRLFERIKSSGILLMEIIR